ncbi:collagen alpha-1(III) chain-like isoform X1 [Canis lupus familiaris]|uniref:collagen alpha-1(III) chain-like isoform X1 n=1 Tax=Canis lupus familiaris TaxID=9615 RepID=UPI0015F1673B|nr:collagen alpha-1(III) chain-like isoform X1 [Canis lupus familiaris]
MSGLASRGPGAGAAEQAPRGRPPGGPRQPPPPSTTGAAAQGGAAGEGGGRKEEGGFGQSPAGRPPAAFPGAPPRPRRSGSAPAPHPRRRPAAFREPPPPPQRSAAQPGDARRGPTAGRRRGCGAGARRQGPDEGAPQVPVGVPRRGTAGRSPCCSRGAARSLSAPGGRGRGRVRGAGLRGARCLDASGAAPRSRARGAGAAAPQHPRPPASAVPRGSSLQPPPRARRLLLCSGSAAPAAENGVSASLPRLGAPAPQWSSRIRAQRDFAGLARNCTARLGREMPSPRPHAPPPPRQPCHDLQPPPEGHPGAAPAPAPPSARKAEPGLRRAPRRAQVTPPLVCGLGPDRDVTGLGLLFLCGARAATEAAGPPPPDSTQRLGRRAGPAAGVPGGPSKPESPPPARTPAPASLRGPIPGLSPGGRRISVMCFRAP